MDNGTVMQGGMQDDRAIYHLSWEVFNDLISILVNTIQVDGLPEIIVGLQRGGLIPAVMLSHQFSTQAVLSLPVRRTASDAVYASKRPPVAVPLDLFQQVTGRDIVVVDDIVGSGATIRAVLHLLRKYEPARIRCATCLVNRANWDPVNDQEPASTISYIGKELSGWVIFPWEKSLATTPTIALTLLKGSPLWQTERKGLM